MYSVADGRERILIRYLDITLKWQVWIHVTRSIQSTRQCTIYEHTVYTQVWADLYGSEWFFHHLVGIILKYILIYRYNRHFSISIYFAEKHFWKLNWKPAISFFIQKVQTICHPVVYIILLSSLRHCRYVLCACVILYLMVNSKNIYVYPAFSYLRVCNDQSWSTACQT